MESQSRDNLSSFLKNPRISSQDLVQCWDDDSEMNLDEEDECDGDFQANDGLYLSKESITSIDANVDKNQLQQTKARNREHAKNTRIRRKNYIETLKDQLLSMSQTHDSHAKEKKMALSTLADKTLHRKSVLETWFQYRTSMESDLTKWRGILEENFQCTMPVTPYRSFPPHQVQNGRRKVAGIADMVFDCLSLHVMLRSSVTPRSQTHLPKVSLRYEVSQESVMATDTFMCKWRLCTEDLVARGAMFEVAKQGMLLAVFSPQNKLLSLELSFDVMGFMQQLRRTTIRDCFQVIPNTIYKSHIEKKDIEIYENNKNNSKNIVNHSDHTSTTSSCGSNISGGGSSGSEVPSIRTAASSQELEALSIFMAAMEPRAVVSAEEPYPFLYCNDRFLKVFHQTTDGVIEGAYISATGSSTGSSNSRSALFNGLIRSKDNHQQRTGDVQDFMKSKQPCTAVLNCSTDGEPPATLPCLCCFYPLFGGGTVQQYLLTLEVIPATTVRLTSEALGQQASSTAPSQQQLLDMHCAPSLNGSTNSGGTLGACSSGSGVTDQASGSSDSPTEMGIVVPATTAHHRHHIARHHENKDEGSIIHKAKSSLSLFSNSASLTSHSTNTDLQDADLGSSSLYDGDSAVGSEDRWIRDFVRTRDNQDQISCCSHSLNPSVAGRSSHKLNRHDLQEPASSANKSTCIRTMANSTKAEIISFSALSDSGSGGNSSRMEMGGSSGNDSGSDNGRVRGGSGGQSPPGGSDSLSSDQMQVMSTERSSPTVSSGSGNVSPGHSVGKDDQGPRRGSSGSEDSGSDSQNSGDGMKTMKDRDGHAVKKRHTYISPTHPI